MDSPDFSPARACIYTFEFGSEAQLGDIMNVEIEGMDRLDLFYAEGANQSVAKGRQVTNPVAGFFKVRFPNSLYITLLNKDVDRTPLTKPITVTFWRTPIDPLLKAEEYSTDLIPPQFAVPL